jgi:hypothetical protein
MTMLAFTRQKSQVPARLLPTCSRPPYRWPLAAAVLGRITQTARSTARAGIILKE